MAGMHDLFHWSSSQDCHGHKEGAAGDVLLLNYAICNTPQLVWWRGLGGGGGVWAGCGRVAVGCGLSVGGWR